MEASIKSSCAVLFTLLACRNCLADNPPPPPEPYSPTPVQVATLAMPDVPFADLLKDLVLKQLPREIVYDKNDNWGHQAHVPSIQGVKPIQVLRNHGNWQKMKVVCPDVPHSARLWVHDLQYGPERISYTVHVTVPATLEYEHKTWQNGIQVQGSHGRARMKFRATIPLLTRAMWDAKGEVLVEGIGPLTVANARVVCDTFVAENVNGIGGDLAKFTGGKLEHAFNEWKGALEHDMQGKIRKAVIQAGESKTGTAGLARLVNAVSAQATALALNPPFSSAIIEPEAAVRMPRSGPAVIQPASTVAVGLGVFIDLHLNGRVDPGRMSESSSHVGSSYHAGHSSGSFSSSSSSSHGDHSSSAAHTDHAHKK